MSFLARLRGLITLGRGTLAGLTEERAGADPIRLFRDWFDEARRSGILLPEAMALATATPDGRPSVRMMLLKGAGERGFVFYTNYESRKGRELDANPRAAVTLHWAALQRQVRIEGTVSKLTPDESYAYFRTRPRGSQLGAWASRQSAEISSRDQLEQRFAECSQRFRGQDVPLPPFWGGFRLLPERIEFWQGRANRLHDRIVYERDGDAWRRRRLCP